MTESNCKKHDRKSNDEVPNESQRSKNICRWAYIVLAATTLNGTLAAGTTQSVNIYYATFLQEFQQSASYTAWIPAAQNAAFSLAGLLVGPILTKLGPRLSTILGSLLMASCFALNFVANSIPFLIVTFSGIGVAMCLIQTGNLMAISSYFKDSSSSTIAFGIMFAGGGIGILVAGLEIEWAIQTFGWRGSMLIKSGVLLQICIGGSLVYKVPEASRSLESNSNKTDSVAANTSSRTTSRLQLYFTDGMFWIFVFGHILVMATLTIMQTVLKSFVISIGLEDAFKTVLVVTGIANLTGRATSGFIAQLIPPPVHYFVASVLATICAIALLFADGQWSLCLIIFLYNLFFGQQIIVLFLNMAWFYGAKEMPIMRGYSLFFTSFMQFSAPPLAGYTVDVTGNYTASILMAGSAAMLSGLISGLGIMLVKRFRKKSPDKNAKFKEGITETDDSDIEITYYKIIPDTF